MFCLSGQYIADFPIPEARISVLIILPFNHGTNTVKCIRLGFKPVKYIWCATTIIGSYAVVSVGIGYINGSLLLSEYVFRNK